MRHHRAIDGTGRYVDDVSRPGQLHLAVVRSNVAHGQVRDIDVADALALPGVVAALRPQDLRPMPHIPIRTAGRPELEPWLQPALADGVVRYVGQPVAAVVAEDAHRAEDAAERVQVAIDPLPAVGAAHEDWEQADVLLELEGRHGPVAEAFARADHVLTQTFRVARRTGAPIETRGVLADWQEGDGVLQTWGPTKFIWFTRAVLAEALGLPEDRVICHRVDVGGMFGTRGEVYPEDLLVAWASRALGRPVKWIEDRREHLLAINQAPEEEHVFELAVSAAGDLLAYRDRVVLDMGAYARPIGSRVPALVIENLPGPYRWEATDVRVTGRLSHKTPVGTVRAPTRIASNFVRERMVDAAADLLGMSPVELRRRNLITPDELPYVRSLDDEERLVYEGGDYPAMMDDLLERADIDGLRDELAERRARGELVGCGVATFLEGSGIGLEEAAAMELAVSGRVRVVTTASEVGQGLDATLREIACARLGLSETVVDVDSGSSFGPPAGRGTYGSRSTVFAGAAVDAACEALLDRLRAAAARRLCVEEAVLAFDGDRVHGPDGSVRWQELAPLRAEATWRSEGPTFGFGMHLAVVSVDADTGLPTVERVIAGYDCGRVIRSAGVVGQLVGGTVQGLGATLMEQLAFAPDGQPQSTSFVEYLLPTCRDVPRVDTVVWQSEGIHGNPLGLRGAGEAGVAGVAAAVGNALADALGGRGPLELPVSPEGLLALADECRVAVVPSIEGASC